MVLPIMLRDTEIKALVKLLDDEDKQVLKHVETKLKSFGTEIIPSLEDAWTTDLNPLQHERLEAIIHDIQLISLSDELRDWREGGGEDLLHGYFLVSKFYYPEAQFGEIKKKIYKLRQTIWLELNYNQTPIEQVKVFNSIFYGYLGFNGQQLSEDPKKYCLTYLLERKEGCSVSLGFLYQILARELNLPVYGVPLTKYFVLAFTRRFLPEIDEGGEFKDEIIFYINPVNRGTLFTNKEISDYLKKMNAPDDPRSYSPASNAQLILELLTYLRDLAIYRQKEEEVEELNALMAIISV